MADKITVRLNGETQFQPHPEGQFEARCVDVIDLGLRWKQFKGNPGKAKPTVALVFATGERNEAGALHDVSEEFTVSVHQDANLRKFLEAWRGKKYEDKQLQQDGVPLDKLEGQSIYLSIAHKVSAAGRTFAYISTAMPLPKGMAAPDVTGWQRPAFWAERKKAYATEVAQHLGAPATDDPYPDFEQVPPGMDDETDLPF
jgi:hypothetical protein